MPVQESPVRPLLGSVRRHCVQHALYLVVVVRGPDPA
jgi:hypothetical protein